MQRCLHPAVPFYTRTLKASFIRAQMHSGKFLIRQHVLFSDDRKRLLLLAYLR